MKNDRTSKPRSKPALAARGGPRKPARSFEPGARRAPPRPRTEASDPYQPARRPPREFVPRGDVDARSARGERARPAERGAGPRERGGFGERERGRGFTVTLDADVARVFRGDASVNRALRLVLQLMQVVQGPPAARRDRPQRGYQGSPEARGFTRPPRFEEDTPDESSE